MVLKATDIKRHVIRGYAVKYGPVPLFVNEHGGEMWATNKSWVTRAERVAPLLDQYNLSAAEPGSYEVNSTVRRANGDNHGIPAQVPNVGRVIADAKDYAPGIPVRIAGQQAYTRDDGHGLYAAFLLADGTHAGLSADELEWLSDTATAPLPGQDDGTHLRYSDVRVSFNRNSHGHVCAMVLAGVFRVTKRAHYADEGRGDLVPAVEEACEPRMLGMMMGMNYGA